jgi:hypothetical protein
MRHAIRETHRERRRTLGDSASREGVGYRWDRAYNSPMFIRAELWCGSLTGYLPWSKKDTRLS